jgi:formate hydrogenlyase transcriptional activator
VQHFVRRFASRMRKEISHIPEGTIEFLRQQEWPGNIRELQNFVERAVIMSPGPNLEIPFGELRHMVEGYTPTPAHTLAEAQRDCILEALRRSGGVVGGRNGAAVRLGMPRTTLVYRMQKLGIPQEKAVRGENAAGWPDPGTSDGMTCLRRDVIGTS